jgi:hypothetical protein
MMRNTQCAAIALSIVLSGCIVGDYGVSDSDPQDLTAGNCTLVVPDHALTAQGLATPYVLLSRNGTCDETNPDTAAFVQAAVISPSAHTIAIYNPLVINAGTTAAAPPVVPDLPDDAVVAIWFGYNGNRLSLRGAATNTLSDADCGAGFGQVAFCNAEDFWETVHNIGSTNLVPPPPPLGTASDGRPCPTVRSFFTVDQDPSDNVTTTYLQNLRGNLSQDTAANHTRFPNATTISNGSDNKLLAIKLDSVLGCTPYRAPNLADPGTTVTAQPLNEIMASVTQAAPIALVPLLDPMVLNTSTGLPDLNKLNRYRLGVGQPLAQSLSDAQAAQLAYCQHLIGVLPRRLAANTALFSQASSPDPSAGSNLYTFLAQRFNGTWSLLTCDQLTGLQSPIQTTFNADGVCTAATITFGPVAR